MQAFGSTSTHFPMMASFVTSRAVDLVRLTVNDECQTLERRVAAGYLRLLKPHFVVDLSRSLVETTRGERYFSPGNLTLSLLCVLVQNRGRALTNEELFEAAWKRLYRPRWDANALNFQISRLRRFILDHIILDLDHIILDHIILDHMESENCFQPVHRDSGRVMLDRSIRVSILEEVKGFQGSHVHVGDVLPAIETMVRWRGSTTNDELRSYLGVGRSQAHHYLQTLVSQNRLLRFGEGRGARYRLPCDSWDRRTNKY